MATDHAPFVLRDAHFWLPPQFLSDHEQGVHPPLPPSGATGGPSFPPVDYGDGCGHSTLTSHGDSFLVSADVSDNEDDFISDLARKVAQSTLEDDLAPLHSKGLFPSGSPKSTLCGTCGCGRVPGRGSLNGLPQMKPVQPPSHDVLYHAAGKVAYTRLCQQQQQQQMDNARYLQQRLPHLIRMHHMKAGVLPYPNQASSYLSALQLSYLLGGNGSKDAKADAGSSPSAWPTLQQAQQPRPLYQGNANCSGGSAGMRAVFLGSSNGACRGSTGTGVFLPRRAGPDPEPKRKQGCSTVLIPAKVVQALNLNLGEMNTPAPLSSSLDVLTESHFDVGRRIRSGCDERRGSHYGQSAVHPEISLPSEWTY